ncbi:MAG: M36 family metallopeptidase [Deltaproteobacteria bacterium]|nr:M36 family metallopeptidase [Deltaproteobacteria bacterium]
MTTPLLLLPVVVLLGAPMEPAAAEVTVAALRPTVLHRDAAGAVDILGGFRFATGRLAPVDAARVFLAAHGAALSLHPSLREGPVTRAGDRAVVRFHETVDGVPVLGAGVAVLVDGDGSVLGAVRGQRAGAVQGRFELSPAQAADVALTARPAMAPAALTRDVLALGARQVLLAREDGLIPAWRLRMDSALPQNSVEILVDARTGAVLSRRRLALDYNAPGKVYDPNPGADGTGATETVALTGLVDGGHLRGEFVEAFNCCKKVECAGTDSDGGCVEQRCVGALEDGGVQARLPFTLPKDLVLSVAPELEQACNLPDPIYVDAQFCASLHKARLTGGGFEFEPLDVATPRDQALRSEEDDFAEVMAYYHVHTFEQHLRDMLGDPQFCLSGQDCTAGVPAAPLHVDVNYMMPALDQSSMTAAICQICAIPFVCPAGSGGKGTSATNPVVFDGLMRVDNAFFQPGNIDQTGLPFDIPGLVSPYDRLVFFQGTQRDFVYDADVIYHEFTHATIHTIVTNAGVPYGLSGAFRDHWGVRDEAGGLNEGFADFFSESFTNSAATGEYAGAGMVIGELGIRNAEDPWNCPDSTTGEVHDDSRAWSSALWSLRKALGAETDAAKANRMEKAVHLAVATLPVNASFAQASAAVKTSVVAEFPGTEGAVDAALADHGVADCVRARRVVRDVNGVTETVGVDYLQFMGVQEAGLLDYAPGHMQLRLDLPARTRSFTLDLDARGGGIAGQMFGSGPADNRMGLVLKPDAAIAYTYSNNHPSHDGTEITVTPNADTGHVNHQEAVSADGLAAPRTYYAGFLVLADSGVTLSNIRITLDVAPAPDAGNPVPDAGSSSSSSSGGGGSGGDAPANPACTCAGTLPGLPAVGLVAAAFAWVRRRRRG